MPSDFIERLLMGEFETVAGRRKVIARARRVGLTRLMLFNVYGHIEPGHHDLDENRRRAVIIQKAVKAFRSAGLGVGINIHTTLGMNMSPPRSNPLPYQHQIDFDGQVFYETYCPIDPGFQAYTDETYAIYAGVEGVDEIWIDDDFRYKNKGGQCFCDLHLAAFAEITGRAWTCEELLTALESSTPLPTDTAVQWSQLQDGTLIDCARSLAAAVHDVAPEMRIGFMPPSHTVLFFGAPCAREIGRALNPQTRGLARPEYGAYTDLDRLGWSAYAPCWGMQRAFGSSYDGWPELETWPGTGYNHSARVIQMKLVWGAMHGYVSSTISNSRIDKPARQAIADAKKQIDAITPFAASADWQTRGISLELSENIIGLRAKVEDICSLNMSESRVLARLGLPLWPAGGDGRILIGNSPLARQPELAEFAATGMVIDRDAFEVLQHLGRNDIIGGAGLLPIPGFPAAEQFADSPINGEAAGLRQSMEPLSAVRRDLPVYELPDTAEFTALHELLDQDGNSLGVSSWVREWDGGRIAVLPFRLSDATGENGLVTAMRKTQIEAMLEWVTQRELPVRFGFDTAYDLQVVYRQNSAGDRVFLGLANFSLDDLSKLALRLPALASAGCIEVRMLDGRSNWQTAECPVGEGGYIELPGKFKIPAMQVRAFELARK